MNWNFFKTNWFYVAMCILLVVYAVRKYPWLNPLKSTEKNAVIEKITEANGTKKGGAALLGIVPEMPKPASDEAGIEADVHAEAFLKRFAQVALSERKKFGVPTSVILACAYANSQAGKREYAQEAHNYFALPCTNDWEGETVRIDGKCMRKYETAWASFRDFSIFLSSQEWFGSLKKSAGRDWHKWVEKLGAEGISNPKTMKKIIEAYRLEELDGV